MQLHMAALLLLFSGLSAHAQKCAPLASLAKALHEEFGEEPLEAGTLQSGSLLTLFQSKSGKTWTLVLAMRPPGKPVMGCLAASGKNWTRTK